MPGMKREQYNKRVSSLVAYVRERHLIMLIMPWERYIGHPYLIASREQWVKVTLTRSGGIALTGSIGELKDGLAQWAKQENPRYTDKSKVEDFLKVETAFFVMIESSKSLLSYASVLRNVAKRK